MLEDDGDGEADVNVDVNNDSTVRFSHRTDKGPVREGIKLFT